MGGKEKLIIIWPITYDCTIGYYEAFEPSQFQDIRVEVIETKELTDKDLRIIQKNGTVGSNVKHGRLIRAFRIGYIQVKHLLYKAINKFRISLYKKDVCFDVCRALLVENTDQFLKSIYEKIVSNLKQGKVCYIEAYCGMIYGEDKNSVDYRVIQLKKQYEQIAAKIINHSYDKVLGVHIRRTDHSVAITNSSTETFTKQIDKILESTKGIAVFLATDSIEEEEKLKERYGDRLITMKKKKWDRSSREGMKEAIIESLCLSLCDCVIGSYTSVFSYFSARYGRKRLWICKNGEDIDIKSLLYLEDVANN